MQTNHSNSYTASHGAPHIVIGGGLAGLTTAATLAQAGEPVLVLERSRQIGGRAASQTRDGFILNQGPHALFRGSLGLPILQGLGVPVQGSTPRPTNLFLQLKGRVYGGIDLLNPSVLPWAVWGDVMRLARRITKLDPDALAPLTVQQWAEQNLRSVRGRALFYSVVRLITYANDPARQGMAAVARRAQEVFANVLYLDGGWQSLVDGLAQAATTAGAVLHTGAAVKRISIGPQGVRVHLDEGMTLDAATVTLAVAPAVVRDLLADLPAQALDGWLPNAPAIHAATLDLALTRLPYPKRTFAVGVDAPLYYSVHSATARLAPEGGVLIHVAKYLPTDAAAGPADEAELRHLMDQLQPGWEQSVVHQRFLPNMVVANALDLPAGQGISRAAIHAPADAPVFVAGDWVESQAMLVDAALDSARRAAQMAIHHVRHAAPRPQTAEVAPVSLPVHA